MANVNDGAIFFFFDEEPVDYEPFTSEELALARLEKEDYDVYALQTKPTPFPQLLRLHCEREEKQLQNMEELGTTTYDAPWLIERLREAHKTILHLLHELDSR